MSNKQMAAYGIATWLVGIATGFIWGWAVFG